MTRVLVENTSDAAEVGLFSTATDSTNEERMFANLVSVTFSAFDPFEPLPNRQDKSAGVQYSYIGLKRVGSTKEGSPLPPQNRQKIYQQSLATASTFAVKAPERAAGSVRSKCWKPIQFSKMDTSKNLLIEA